MEYRYLIAGLNILIISCAFLVFSLLTGNNVIAGVSLSFTVLGGVLLALGITYTEPLSELMTCYARDLSTYLTKLLEDAGIVSSCKLTLCRVGGAEVAVFSERFVSCTEVKVGVGLVGESAYVTFPLSKLGFSVGTAPEGVDLADYLRDVLVSRYGLCKDVRAVISEDVVTVDLTQVVKGVDEFVKDLVNPVKLVVLVAVSRYFSSNVELVSESIVGGVYSIRTRVRR